MMKNDIPTAAHRTFTDAEEAMAYVEDPKYTRFR